MPITSAARIHVLAGLALCLVWPGPAPAALAVQPEPSALLDAYVAALGGEAAQAKLYNRVATGSIELLGLGLKGTVTETSQQPTASRMVMELAGLGRIEAGTDGATAWEMDSIQGPRLLEGAERALALRATALTNGVAWRELYSRVDYAGADSVGGRLCHKVILTAADGGAETWFLDADDHLLRKTSTVVETVMGQVPVETTYDDYRPVDGVLQPYATVQTLLVQRIRLTYDRIQHNVELRQDAFVPPPEVRALLQAAAGMAPAAGDSARPPTPDDKTPDTP